MIFSSFKQPPPPIAVDFGVARLKVLQVSAGADGGPPTIVAAATRPTPTELTDKPGARLEHQAAALGEIIKSSGFRGKRAVCSVSSAHALVQHMQVNKQDGRSPEQQVHEELLRITGRDASQFILRQIEIGEVTRGGGKRTEMICLAMPREAVIAHMKALQHARLEAVGIHAEHMALVKGFERLAAGGDGAHLLIDIGCGTTKIAVCVKGALRLAKVLPIGMQHLYKSDAKAPEANPRSALRAQLKALAATETAVAVLDTPAVEAPPALDAAAADALADEVSQCVRYYHALAPETKIADATLLGGGATRAELCKRLARAFGVPARIADPLNALPHDPAARFDGVALDAPAPEWAVVLGLCSLPTEA